MHRKSEQKKTSSTPKKQQFFRKRPVIIIATVTIVMLGLLIGTGAAFASGALVIESEEYKQINQAIESERKSLASEQEQLTELDKELNQTTQDLQEVEKQINETSQSIEALNSEIPALEAQISDKQWEVYKAKVAYNDALVKKTILERGAEELYGINMSMSEVEQEIASTKAVYDQKQAEYNSLVNEKDQKVKEKSDAEAKLKDLEQQKQKLTEQQSQEQAEKQELENSIKQAQDSLKGLEDKVENSKHWTQKVQGEITDFFNQSK